MYAKKREKQQNTENRHNIRTPVANAESISVLGKLNSRSRYQHLFRAMIMTQLRFVRLCQDLASLNPSLSQDLARLSKSLGQNFARLNPSIDGRQKNVLNRQK